MYAFGYRIEGNRGVIVALKCLDCQHTTRNPRLVKRKICEMCGTKFSPEDLSAGDVRLLNPSALEKSLPINPKANYQLYKGLSKKSRKLHWTINGSTALCMAQVSTPAVDQAVKNYCANCQKLKKRHVAR